MKRIQEGGRQSKSTIWAELDKNLMNYTIARDTRTRLHWKRFRNTGNWYSDISKDVRLFLPKDFENRRAPSPFDFNLLCTLFAFCQRQGKQTLQFRSKQLLLQWMNAQSDQKHRDLIEPALELFAALECRLPIYQEGRPCVLEPFIKDYDLSAPITITLGDEIYSMHRRPPKTEKVKKKDKRGYFGRTGKLPLPWNATALNLALILLARWDRRTENAHVFGTPRRLLRRLGLEHSTRGRAFETGLRIVKEWLRARDYVLRSEIGRQRIDLYLLPLYKIEPAAAKPIEEEIVEAEPAKDDFMEGFETYSEAMQQKRFEQKRLERKMKALAMLELEKGLHP